MFKIVVAKKPTKFLCELPQGYKNAIIERLKELETDLKPHGTIHLVGRENCFRLRVGPFRVQYQFFKEENSILIYKITRRKETTYKSLLV